MNQHNQIAEIIYSSFLQLHQEFHQITQGAKSRFDNKQWKEQREAVQARISSGDRIHQNAIVQIKSLGVNSFSFAESERIEGIVLEYSTPDQAWLHAFADDVLRFFCERNLFRNITSSSTVHTCKIGPGDLSHLLNDLLEGYRLSDKEHTIQKISHHLKSAGILNPEDIAEITYYPHLLYRNQHAYLLAIYHSPFVTLPFILPFVNQDGGIAVDAFLTEERDLMQIFSFTRSYFQVVCDNPLGLSFFIKSLIPNKPLPQLLINLGYQDHGKKLLLGELENHLETSGELFDFAPGIKGMVMIVFTAPKSNYVLKVIRDTPKPPKESTKEEVIKKYYLVASLDRAGRVADAQRYLKVYFPESAFAPALLEELKSEAKESCKVRNGIVELSDVYLERKMIPMNLFLSSFPELAKPIILDYGKAIIEMTSSNLFPGDMLIKNFGVVGARRVIFYDYDEVSLVTDCEFLPLPASADDEDIERNLVVYPNQIFPEELIRFILPQHYRSILTDSMGELFTPEYWNKAKSSLKKQIYDDKAPYVPNL